MNSERSASEGPLIAFTIAARNFIPYAKSLHASLREHHPDVQFFLGLCDVRDGFDEADLGFEIIDVTVLRDTRIWAMAERYNATEFCTAIKPWLFLHLMARFPGHRLCYFDPDIWVLSPLDELVAAFRDGAQAILTPHILTPSNDARMPDQTMLRYGIYNLGFIGVRDSAATQALMRWWADRLETACVIDLPEGLFVDQKWADLIPALLDRVHILRHPGYNIGYWNVLQRRVRLGEGGWLVTAEGSPALPVRFVHFSGYDNIEPGVFSRHARYLDYWLLRDLVLLLPLFRERVLAAGFMAYARLPYAFGWMGASGQNEHTPKEVASRLAHGPVPLEQPLATMSHDDPALFSVTVDGWHSWVAARDRSAAVFREQRALEQTFEDTAEQPFSLTGICSMCRIRTRFAVDYTYALQYQPGAPLVPNWRESNACSCGFPTRIRGAMHALQTLVAPAPDASIYVTEQVTALYKWLRLRWPETVGSEFFSPAYTPGQLYEGVRHEDLCHLTFQDAQFDVVLSFDVLEHVADLDAALRECYRVLRPGGTLLFTAPTQYDHGRMVDLVNVRQDGTVEYLRTPEFHGNPVNADEGSLCFRYFGFDVLNKLREAGFETANAVVYWSRHYALLGRNQNLFLARKGKA